MKIYIEGCHDETVITEEDWGKNFGDVELIVLRKLARISRRKSEYDCQPIIRIKGVRKKWEK